MSDQLGLNLPTPRQIGEEASQACTDKAEIVSEFDTRGAQLRVLELLAVLGPTPGEQLVERLKAEGFRGHDDRCFGQVFCGLSKKSKILCVGYCARKRGHGTAGGRIWGLMR